MGLKVKQIREAKGLTQTELAKRSGISRQTISAIENGKTEELKIGTVKAIAAALETTIDEIFFEETV